MKMRGSTVNFDPLAPFYRAMETFTAGGKLQRCRVAFLDEIPVPRRALLAGEGHGRFLPECVKRFPDTRILVVDSSERMLEIARNSVSSMNVDFLHVDFLDWEGPHGAFDLIVTHFFLDCFPPDELATVVGKLEILAAPRADWLLADFQMADGMAAGLRSRVILAMLYRFFRVVSGLKARVLTPPDALIRDAGFSLNRRVTREWGLLKSEWWRR